MLTRLLTCPTLADRLRQGRDNFLLLRLIAAILVVFGHSYAISALPGSADFIALSGWGPGVYTGSIAVDIFFVISGFLVTGSYVQRDQLRFFVRARVLRIVPAFLFCIVVTALLIGPLVTRLPLIEYLVHPDTLAYIWKNLDFIGIEWYLPGVFESNPLPRVVNGSLWTLPVEVRMYVLVAAFGAVGLLRNRTWFNLMLPLFVVLALLFPELTLKVLRPENSVRLAGLFALGAFFYMNRQQIPLSGILAAALIAIAWWSHGSDYFMTAFGVALAYSVLWLAYVPRLNGIDRFGDYSYGVFLWGYPVQQIVAMVADAPTPMMVFAWSLPTAFLLAILSWHLIEKPALRLKTIPLVQWPSFLFKRTQRAH